MHYDYKKGAQRVDEILNSEIVIKNDSETLPKDDSKFSFSNGYYVWITAIFVDIRDSSQLFSQAGLENAEETGKLIRAFTSEIIEILRLPNGDSDFLREIGIRGDCVYATFSTPLKSDILACADKTFYINTYLNMLNKKLVKLGKPEFKAGIGMASGQELVLKAGRDHTGINSKVWIGNAVNRASNLSSLGQSEITSQRLFYSECAFHNFIAGLKQRNSDKDVDSWFTKYTDDSGNVSQHAGIIKTDFDSWIENEMN
ncbi:adenylate/guanylate cyclase domain-containing protein [Leuconostoc mesenteroides]|uniref:adenylate/guanylate cyclase domain-containing protein n=1 Tax=Leuconostoc mesenteroides TaxID=1245 RepID=UPI0023614766|nr:adenylate/guanylate cyclase domain-containing protein [Leuconostoc mesenteroides]